MKDALSRLKLKVLRDIEKQLNKKLYSITGDCILKSQHNIQLDTLYNRKLRLIDVGTINVDILGALFASFLRVGGKEYIVKKDSSIDGNSNGIKPLSLCYESVFNYLLEYYSDSQLQLIYACLHNRDENIDLHFKELHLDPYTGYDREQAKEAVKLYYKKYPSFNTRFRSILDNMKNNEGYFIPCEVKLVAL